MVEVIVTLVVPEKDGEPMHTEIFRYEFEEHADYFVGIRTLEAHSITGGQMQNR